MLPFFSKIKELSQTRVSGAGLAVFRIIFSLVLIYEVGNLFYYRHLFFDPIPYLQESEISYSIMLVFWIVVLLFLLVGWQTRKAALINYIFVLTTFSSLTSAKYHLDTTLTGLSFLFLFLPVAHNFSFDRLILREKTLGFEAKKVRKIYYYLPVLLIPGLQYFDSVFHKLASGMWLSGLGVWLPASLPNQINLNVSPLLNLKWLVVPLGYSIILFEALFIFLIYFRKTRLWASLFGAAMHIGIGIIFPVPVFGFLLASVYILLVPPAFWEKLSGRFFNSSSAKSNAAFPKNSFFNQISHWQNYFGRDPKPNSVNYNPENQIQNPILSLPDSSAKAENFKARIFYFFILYLLLGQFIKTLNAPLITNFTAYTGIHTIQKTATTIFYPVEVLNKKFLGITEGLIYTNFQEGSFYITTLAYLPETGKPILLPLLTSGGTVDPQLTGRLFTRWNRVNMHFPQNMPLFENGLVQFSSFWAAKNNIPLKNARFQVLQKKVVIQNKWEKDFLQKQLQMPWRQAGIIHWQSKKPKISLH